MGGLNAGDLDREVLIQQLADDDALANSEDASGFPVERWIPLDIVWLQRMTTTGAEKFRAAQLSAAIETRWQLHWRDDMDPDAIDVPKKRRLVFQDRIYDITAAAEIGRQEGIELTTLASERIKARA